MVHRRNKLTKNYSGQVVPMIGYATIEFSCDPNGEYTFPLTVWITEMRTQNLLGMDFCQNQASGIHFNLPGIELRQPPKTFCYGSLHQNKTFPYVSRFLTVRLPYTMHVDAKCQVLEVFTSRPKISLPSWINFSTQQGSCGHRSCFCKH